jgi:hypothetical protein
MTVAPDLVELRERVARIISPQTFELIEHYDGLLQSKPGDAFKAYPSLRTQRDEALAKADAILALQQVERTEVADDAAEFADWHRRVREWSGSSFLAGERMSAEKQLDAKGALYSDLCSLGNFLLWWADRLASPRGGEGEEEGSSRDNDPGTGSSVLRAQDLERAEELLSDPDAEDCERFASWYGRSLLDIAREHQKQRIALDQVWAAVNVLGAPDTACRTDEERAYCRAIGDALAEIEKLGGKPW